jgi:hypothetical protein
MDGRLPSRAPRLSIYVESIAAYLDRYELPGQNDFVPEPTSLLALEVQLYRSTLPLDRAESAMLNSILDAWTVLGSPCVKSLSSCPLPAEGDGW